jgi:signal transduction histidine kinase
MKKKALLTRALLLITLWIVLSLLIGNLAARVISRQEYEFLSHILSTLTLTEPDTADALIQALKVPPTNSDDGAMLLKKYNYSQDTFVGSNVLIMTAVIMVSLSIPFLFLLFLQYRQYAKNKARIDELTGYLEEINAGKNVLLKPREDEYSILEDQIYKTVTQLLETREAAQNERNSLADNLADISHQLKTPITSMSLMAQLLADNSSEENAIYIERLLRQLNRLETLVTALLTLSKLDTGTLVLEQGPVDINSMLLRATEPIEEMIHQKRQILL